MKDNSSHPSRAPRGFPTLQKKMPCFSCIYRWCIWDASLSLCWHPDLIMWRSTQCLREDALRPLACKSTSAAAAKRRRRQENEQHRDGTGLHSTLLGQQCTNCSCHCTEEERIMHPLPWSMIQSLFKQKLAWGKYMSVLACFIWNQRSWWSFLRREPLENLKVGFILLNFISMDCPMPIFWNTVVSAG